MYSNDFSEYSDEEFSIALNRNIDYLTRGKQKHLHPRAFLLGGQPGSGKTTLHTIVEKQLNNDVIIIDNDKFKHQHPNFKKILELHGANYVDYVTPFSNRMTESIIQSLISQKYNLVIEGTLRTTDVPIKTAKLLLNNSYDIFLLVMGVSKELSYLGTLARYEHAYKVNPATARRTSKVAHDVVVQNIADNLDYLHKQKLFKSIHLYDREENILYNSLNNSLLPGYFISKELHKPVSRLTLEREYANLKTLSEANGHFNENYAAILQQINELNVSKNRTRE
ncbi:zeta toxin family protein [Aerococcaceae bacterium NML171108]|nr:zeta toxin family protein [Aerococcaceae bacterium NML171108]